MMKRTVKGYVKQTMQNIMESCKECGGYFTKDTFCRTCMLAEDSIEKNEKERSKNSIESR